MNSLNLPNRNLNLETYLTNEDYMNIFLFIGGLIIILYILELTDDSK